MKRALIGAGGFAREIKSHMGDNSILFFVDDSYYFGDEYTLPLSKFNPDDYEVIIAVGDSKSRIDVKNRLPKNTKYFTYIDKSVVILDKNIQIGEGSIICAGCILTTNINIGCHTHLNLQTTIGHDTSVGNFLTTAPGVKISGNCVIGNSVYVGTNASIKEKITICDNVTLGMNSATVKNITEPGTYVGVPSKKIK
jgi:sugar O-acyltransferase (sialic acid O-acetyltransferase NeuD family)